MKKKPARSKLALLLKHIKEAQGLTYAEMGRRLGLKMPSKVATTYMHRWINGTRPITDSRYIIRIMRVFNITAQEIDDEET